MKTVSAERTLGQAAIEKPQVRTVHIDTSIQIERCKEAKKAKVVEKILKDFRFKSTSSYAKFEFKRAWLRDLAFLYKASRNVEKFGDVIAYVDEHLNAYPMNRRRVSRCLQAITAFLARATGDLSDEADILRFRTYLINAILGAYSWWDFSVTHEYNGTGCTRASEPPTQRAGGYIDVSIPQCRPNKCSCTVHAFFEANKERFIALKSEIEKLGGKASKELQEAAGVIRQAEKKPESLCDEKKCLKLGDVLIAIDGLDMDWFAANNDKEWVFLSRILGKRLVNPVRAAKKASQV